MSMSMTLLRKGPWWLGLAVMFMGAVCIYASTELPATAQYAAVGPGMFVIGVGLGLVGLGVLLLVQIARGEVRSEEHTSELQSLMRISYAVFCLKKKKKRYVNNNYSRTSEK